MADTTQGRQAPLSLHPPLHPPLHHVVLLKIDLTLYWLWASLGDGRAGHRDTPFHRLGATWTTMLRARRWMPHTG
jgi:hypothetical protein